MTPELFNLLKWILTGILTVVAGLSINAYCEQPSHRGQKPTAIAIGVLAGILGAWLNAVEMSQGEPQPNSVYASLGLSTGFALPALAYLLWLYGQSREREAESQLRQQLLERIRKEVEDRRQDALDQLYHIPPPSGRMNTSWWGTITRLRSWRSLLKLFPDLASRLKFC